MDHIRQGCAAVASEPRTVRLGAVQRAGLEIYVLDIAHADDGDPGLVLHGSTLTVSDRARAMDVLNEASESAYLDGDQAVSDALTTLRTRIARSEK